MVFFGHNVFFGEPAVYERFVGCKMSGDRQKKLFSAQEVTGVDGFMKSIIVNDKIQCPRYQLLL